MHIRHRTRDLMESFRQVPIANIKKSAKLQNQREREKEEREEYRENEREKQEREKRAAVELKGMESPTLLSEAQKSPSYVNYQPKISSYVNYQPKISSATTVTAKTTTTTAAHATTKAAPVSLSSIGKIASEVDKLCGISHTAAPEALVYKHRA
jgi:hypothetical protein